jgi:hypothetical protein
LLNARDTVATETRARRATSWIVIATVNFSQTQGFAIVTVCNSPGTEGVLTAIGEWSKIFAAENVFIIADVFSRRVAIR